MKHYIQHTVALFAILFSTLTATAQTQTTHEVQRGETLETVAQKYGITTEALLQANPDAADMFFTGMKLQIPAAATTATSTTTTTTSTTTTATTGPTTTTTTTAVAVQPTPQTQVVSENTTSTEPTVSAQSRKGTWTPAFEIGYGFLQFPKIEGYKINAFGYKASMGANYNITDSWYAGARIGYNSANYDQSLKSGGSSGSTEMHYHFVTLPIETGYRFMANENVGVMPFVGFEFNVCVAGTQKQGTDKSKKIKDIGGKLGVSARVGARLSIYGWSVAFAYVLPVNEKQEFFFGDKAYPEVMIGWGF